MNQKSKIYLNETLTKGTHIKYFAMKYKIPQTFDTSIPILELVIFEDFFENDKSGSYYDEEIDNHRTSSFVF